MALLRAATLSLLVGVGCGVFAQVAASAQGVAHRIDELLATPAARRTYWGVLVRDLDTGKTVYERNADKLFVPASNVKLFSTALALHRLGADYTFKTIVTADGSVDEEGTLRGDLRLVGGGDPNLSARVMPYRNKEEFESDSLAPVRLLARSIRDAGIRKVAGDLIGDDSRYVWQPYPIGWSHHDTLQGYGSAVGALVFNDNIVKVHVGPGAVGQPARLRVSPSLPLFKFVNRTATASGTYVVRRLAARRGEVPGEVVLAGQIPSHSRGRSFHFAGDDPALYAALALRQALRDIGVMVEGETRSHHLLPDRLPSLRSLPRRNLRGGGGYRLAERTSVALREAVRVVNKVSQNLHAEMLLREVAYQESGIGSQEATVTSLRRFLAEVGLKPGEFHLRDGSGLSRHDLLAPTATVRLLEFMWNSTDREAYVASLPVAGYDGTLDWRLRRTAARGRIRAKTGSMSHVLALSGYAEDYSGRTYAFSIYANNFGMSSSSTRHLADSVAAALVLPDRE